MAGARTDVVDQLRAFALLGICLVNMPFIAAPILTGPPTVTALDQVAAFLIAWLGAAKFFLIFAFLFGWGFGVQQRSASRAGVSFTARFLRRTLGLAVIGVAHAALIFAGDILLPYALISLVFLPLSRLGSRSLVRVAALMIVVAALVLAMLATAISGDIATDTLNAPTIPASLTALVSQRVADWQLAFPFIMMFNGPLVLGAFCLGLAAERTGFFAPGNYTFVWLKRRVGLLWLVGLLLNLPFAAAAAGFLHGTWAGAAMVLLALAAPILAAAYVVSAVELFRRRWLPPSFGLAGRMSLTAYVAEGALGSLVFFGLGWFGAVGQAGVAGIAVAIYLTVELLCAAWLRLARQGPLEAVLRAVTYGRPRPAASLPER